VFRRLWVAAPASTRNADGLGPLYNARGCQSCHMRDGRGRPPEPGEPASSLLIRLSVPPEQARQTGPAPGWLPADPDPTYGLQLQTFGIAGHPAEARVAVEWTEQPETLAGGEVVTLRRPDWRLSAWAYGPPAPGLMASPRIAPPMIGLGLLEAIPETAILAGADPEDRDGDGISGRAARVWSGHRGAASLGRFGWKAQAPTMEDQVADALTADMGLSTAINPAPHGECTARQAACRAAEDGTPAPGQPEVDPRLFNLVVFYARNLAVPAGRCRARRRCAAAPCSAKSPAPPATRRGSPPGRSPAARSIPTSASGRIRTCCCTTWARAWPTTGRRGRRMAANGARRRSGASATPAPSAAIPSCCMTAAPAACWKPSSGTAARHRRRATPRRRCRPTTVPP
jgi:CxxC motif-containing protein (DUF1111 family)